MPSDNFSRIEQLPPYVFAKVNALKKQARAAGDDIIDMGMGNPDQQTPQHIVDKLVEVAQRQGVQRYSEGRGIARLRKAISNWYQERFDVSIDPDSEAIVTMGSKEGLAHLAFAITNAGDNVLVPSPSYPIHEYGFILAGAKVHALPLINMESMINEIETTAKKTNPKVLLLNFPANPTTHCVELGFFEAIIELAKRYDFWVVHDFAYADLCFDSYQAPSLLQITGAKSIAVETYSLSKSYNMPGWRVGFVCGNQKLIGALTRLKSYLDYGLFTPLQVAAISALEGPKHVVQDIRLCYQRRRDVLCEGLSNMGWQVDIPKATMFTWVAIPEEYKTLSTLSFSELLLEKAKVAVSPGTAFGQHGEGHVRFSLIENEQRIRQAIRNIRRLFNQEDKHPPEDQLQREDQRWQQGPQPITKPVPPDIRVNNDMCK